ncbi:hypothetical protein [Nitrosopumilus sp.]|uniref:hypothetical protein n=1 Tax=Nitrosopumilus sp. TaxID=2024843 RepID=UPI00292EE2C3|nr:hypothetical protein [Nitrosopumilus sp.]
MELAHLEIMHYSMNLVLNLTVKGEFSIFGIKHTMATKEVLSTQQAKMESIV